VKPKKKSKKRKGLSSGERRAPAPLLVKPRKMLEVFLFSNGTECTKWAKRCLKEQTLKCGITVVNRVPLVHAMRVCLKLCCRHYFVKVDDDMFLHPRALEFYNHMLNHAEGVSMYACCLWDFFRETSVFGLKAYHVDIFRGLGFRADNLGRVDRTILEDLKGNGSPPLLDGRSLVGVHAAKSAEDQAISNEVWSKANQRRVRRERSQPRSYKDQYRLSRACIGLSSKVFGKSKFATYAQRGY